MHDSPRSDIGELLDAMTDGRAERFAAMMLGRCWPGNGVDRNDPVAVEWLRSWGPRRTATLDLLLSHN